MLRGVLSTVSAERLRELKKTPRDDYYYGTKAIVDKLVVELRVSDAANVAAVGEVKLRSQLVHYLHAQAGTDEQYVDSVKKLEHLIATEDERPTNHCGHVYQIRSEHPLAPAEVHAMTQILLKHQSKGGRECRLSCQTCQADRPHSEMISCAVCRMGSYCSDDCRREDAEAHRRICQHTGVVGFDHGERIF